MAKGITPIWGRSANKKEFFGFMVVMDHFNKKTAYFLRDTFPIGYMQYVQHEYSELTPSLTQDF